MNYSHIIGPQLRCASPIAAVATPDRERPWVQSNVERSPAQISEECPFKPKPTLTPSAPHRLGVLLRHVATLAKERPGAFMLGKQPFPSVPHIHADTPFGHKNFTPELAAKCEAAAQKNPNGIVTFWLGPILVVYIANKKARDLAIQEEHLGVIHQNAADFLSVISGGNRVMHGFPAFQPRDSKTYQYQRAHLKDRFDGGAEDRLPKIIAKGEAFFRKSVGKTFELREFLTALVLCTSSELVDLPWSMEHLLPKYKDTIARLAQYGISDSRDKVYEQQLYDLFMTIFRHNFEHLKNADPKINLIRAIFVSRGVNFPLDIKEFEKLPADQRMDLAANILSILIGAKVHSTMNSLNWAWARLLKDHATRDKLAELVKNISPEELSSIEIFDKSGKLGLLTEYILDNIAKYPTFGHQSFIVPKPYKLILKNGTSIQLPAHSFIFVNYKACNDSNAELATAQQFQEALKAKKTVSHFVHGQLTASFGGSRLHEGNTATRTCPGAPTSIFEQIILTALMLQHFDIVGTNISLEQDPRCFPVIGRKSGDENGSGTKETIILIPRMDNKAPMPILSKL
jgi:cytochrome P450